MATQEPKLLGPAATESLLLTLLSRVDAARHRALVRQQRKRYTMSHEMKTIEFWRSVIAECLASFIYVFLVCATHLTWSGSMYIFGPAPNWLVISLTSGFAMATLVQCFSHISGGHVNPTLTLSLMFTKKITPLRGFFYIVGHCCGAIAGAALLYGVTVSSNQSMGSLGLTIAHDSLNPWQVLTVEAILTFLVIFTTYATIDPHRKSFGSDSLSIGLAYLVASLTGLPASGAALNPARSLGPAFVMNRWQDHWVYWVGPLLGGVIAGIVYEFIFDMRRIGSFTLDSFDDLERVSNVEDDYEDPDMNKLGSSHKVYLGSASAASSGSSSGQRSSHTQHSIVSVHGPGNQGPGPQSYEPYRPMIGAFQGAGSIQEISPVIYNEPTGPGFYGASATDRQQQSSGNSSGGNGSSGGSGSTFFSSAGAGPQVPQNNQASGRFSHTTMRASMPHHRLTNYDGSMVQTINPKF